MNGVIHMGNKSEFEQAFGVKCSVDNDAEIFLRHLEKEDDNGDALTPLSFINSITGSFAGVWLENHDDGLCVLYAARNPRRPLWMSTQHGAVWVASTLDIFLRAGFEGARALPAGEIHCEAPYFNTQVDALLAEKMND
tara:strand:- start:372 stop:785 length:414 start_codon:yes stop_codon:yes gene_type:complete